MRDAPWRQPAWRRCACLTGPDVAAGVDDEMELHIQLLAEKLQRQGLPPTRRARAVQGVIRAVDPTQPVYAVRPMDEVIRRSIGDRRLDLGLLAAFAGVALALAVAGIYGVRPWDPATFAGVAALLAAVSVVSSWLPSRRVARVDPIVAMRAE